MKIKHKIKLLAIALAMVMAMTALASCAGNSGSGATTIKIGTQGYAEVEILGEIFKIVVEAKTDHKVEHVRSLGSAMAGYEATKANDLQAFTGFTGTFFLGLLNEELTEETSDPRYVYEFVRVKMGEEYDMYCAEPWGYNNTYGIAVDRAWAEENNVVTQSDMAPFAPNMRLAVDQTWLNYPGQGYKEYTEIYGFEYKDVIPMDL
ncbi:MAG: glycine betaine ABC transporter substrate-binding protein, partial [Eubacteriales bacterium]|nr:glycine betaine ABC transporter substrate-binding protein [Eubacteriales bacterium]